MHRKIITVILIYIAVVAIGRASAQEAFLDYCLNTFLNQEVCPPKLCEMKCPVGEVKDPKCIQGCLPKECPTISAANCPSEYCSVMKDCSEKKICHYKMEGGQPACGDLAYAGQDVKCCEGLVKRCGVELLEGICDMQGKDSVYNIPICIPCGDGLCSQFEDRCNCPEDCQRKPVLSSETLKKSLKEKGAVSPLPLNMEAPSAPPRIIEIFSPRESQR